MSTQIIDLRAAAGPIGDQGSRGTCVAFALTAVHMAAIAETFELSEEYLFWAAKKRDGWLGDGTTYRAALSGLSEDGQCTAALWPYHDGRSHVSANYSPPADAVQDAQNRTGDGDREFFTVSDVRASLEAGVLIAVGIPVWDEFATTNGTDVLQLPSAIATSPLEHAVVIVGHDADRSALLVRNSWGTGWADEGHAWVDDAIIATAVIVDGWTIDRTDELLEAANGPG